MDGNTHSRRQSSVSTGQKLKMFTIILTATVKITVWKVGEKEKKSFQIDLGSSVTVTVNKARTQMQTKHREAGLGNKRRALFNNKLNIQKPTNPEKLENKTKRQSGKKKRGEHKTSWQRHEYTHTHTHTHTNEGRRWSEAGEGQVREGNRKTGRRKNHR